MFRILIKLCFVSYLSCCILFFIFSYSFRHIVICYLYIMSFLFHFTRICFLFFFVCLFYLISIGLEAQARFRPMPILFAQVWDLNNRPMAGQQAHKHQRLACSFLLQRPNGSFLLPFGMQGHVIEWLLLSPTHDAPDLQQATHYFGPAHFMPFLCVLSFLPQGSLSRHARVPGQSTMLRWLPLLRLSRSRFAKPISPKNIASTNTATRKADSSLLPLHGFVASLCCMPHAFQACFFILHGSFPTHQQTSCTAPPTCLHVLRQQETNQRGPVWQANNQPNKGAFDLVMPFVLDSKSPYIVESPKATWNAWDSRTTPILNADVELW